MHRIRNRTRFGFTLVELLVVIVVIAVLAAVVLPKFINSGQRGKESALKANLTLVRNAVELFHNDTGYWPSGITDLAATTAPTNGLDDTGASKAITASSWHGPYLQSIPTDSVSGSALSYSTTSGTVGKVTSSASGSDSSGVQFSDY